MLGHVAKTEANFVAADLLAAANLKISALETELANLKQASADGAVQIVTLTEGAATAKAALDAKETESKNFQAQLGDAQAKIIKLSDVISGQGLSLDDLPALEANEDANKSKETAWTKYQRLQAGNPREAGAFWMANADEILRTQPK